MISCCFGAVSKKKEELLKEKKKTGGQQRTQKREKKQRIRSTPSYIYHAYHRHTRPGQQTHCMQLRPRLLAAKRSKRRHARAGYKKIKERNKEIQKIRSNQSERKKKKIGRQEERLVIKEDIYV
jgi:hypothetical protein